jgi:acetyltransferase-like isoleucine patch superfamily enzyme
MRRWVLKYFIGRVGYLWLRIVSWQCRLTNSWVSFSKITCSRKSSLHIRGSWLVRSSIYVAGAGNRLEVSQAHIEKSSLRVEGSENYIKIANNAILRGVELIVRGNHCNIEIGERTSFGGARMVVVGDEVGIYIGNDCLLSDKIEIWASDTHSIFNKNGNLINQEKSIIVEDGVWVGSGAAILKGVRIGAGSIIGMNSVVTKNIDPSSIYAGFPAAKIKDNVTWTLDYKSKSQF